MTQEHSKKGWHSFLKLCTMFQTPEELNQFFDLFLTIEEKETLASRF